MYSKVHYSQINVLECAIYTVNYVFLICNPEAPTRQ